MVQAAEIWLVVVGPRRQPSPGFGDA